MKRRYSIAAIVALAFAGLAISVRFYYKTTYPYGQSHCCIIYMMGVLRIYASDHAGHYPTGETSPEASLSLLYRSNYMDAATLRGMTVSEKTVRTVLEGGGLL